MTTKTIAQPGWMPIPRYLIRSCAREALGPRSARAWAAYEAIRNDQTDKPHKAAHKALVAQGRIMTIPLSRMVIGERSGSSRGDAYQLVNILLECHWIVEHKVSANESAFELGYTNAEGQPVYYADEFAQRHAVGIMKDLDKAKAPGRKNEVARLKSIREQMVKAAQEYAIWRANTAVADADAPSTVVESSPVAEATVQAPAVLTDLETQWQNDIKCRYPEVQDLPKWGGKERGQVKNMLSRSVGASDVSAEELVSWSMRYCIENWDALKKQVIPHKDGEATKGTPYPTLSFLASEYATIAAQASVEMRAAIQAQMDSELTECLS